MGLGVLCSTQKITIVVVPHVAFQNGNDGRRKGGIEIGNLWAEMDTAFFEYLKLFVEGASALANDTFL
jgi:hypothetical protein